MKKAFKYRFYPNQEQQQCLAKQFGSIVFAYNNALAFKKEVYDTEKKHISKYDLTNRLVGLKQEYPWLTGADSQVLQQAICHLDRALGNFFDERTVFPRFKNKYSWQSIHYPQRVKINQENKKIYLPKVGWIKIIFHRVFEGKIKTVVISKIASGKYYVSVLCETTKALPLVIYTIDQEKDWLKIRNKARIVVAKVHEKIAVCRSYFQHVMTK